MLSTDSYKKKQQQLFCYINRLHIEMQPKNKLALNIELKGTHSGQVIPY